MRTYLLTALTTVALLNAAGTPPAAQAAGRCGQHPWCDMTLTPQARAALLLAAMTTDEKVALLGGDEFTGAAGGAHSHTGTQHGIPRLDVPTVLYSDGPVGPRQGRSTGLPVPLALAATFDPALAAAHGAVAAGEARDKGNDVIFGPAVNIARTPLSGRTFENYGEDPFLQTRMVVAWIKAAQAAGVIADVKHFAANNQEGVDISGGQSAQGVGVEGSRLIQNSVVDERTLREIYLPHFEAAVKEAKVGSVMCSYNRINGQYGCENQHLLRTILRKEWGFDGYVLADYG
ncbi:MAG: glycosyl hydrolase, partial [Solirubrobacterales bacterium]|nr:glycosyl hydrolase [Solirubrobacterales bacterium]